MKPTAVIVLIALIPMLVGCGGVSQPTDATGQPRLVRIPQLGMLGGVCAGLAYYFGMSPTPIRVIWVGAVLLAGTGILLYVALWVILPSATHVPPDYAQRIGAAP